MAFTLYACVAVDIATDEKDAVAPSCVVAQSKVKRSSKMNFLIFIEPFQTQFQNVPQTVAHKGQQMCKEKNSNMHRMIQWTLRNIF